MPDVVTGVPPIVSVEFESERPTDETVALLVLHVPEPVIAPVPLPVRHPVRDVAPVPPLATVSLLVSVSVPIVELVAHSFVVAKFVEEAFVIVRSVPVGLNVNAELLAKVAGVPLVDDQ